MVRPTSVGEVQSEAWPTQDASPWYARKFLHAKAATARGPRFRRNSETNGTPGEIPGAGNLAFDLASNFFAPNHQEYTASDNSAAAVRRHPHHSATGRGRGDLYVMKTPNLTRT